MRLKRMLRMLKNATEKQASLYSEHELEYMRSQLQVIESEMKKLEHKDYRGFGNKYG